MDEKILIYGTGQIAEILFAKLSQAGASVFAFVVEKNYKTADYFLELPVFAFEEIEKICPPHSYKFIIGIWGNMLNKLRTRFYHAFKEKGYEPISYIDKSASLLPSVTLGEHCVILENVVAHSKVKIGNNVFVLPHAYLGHHTIIEDNCFIASNVTLASGAIIKKGCFLGASSSVANDVILGENNLLAMGSPCTKSSPANTLIINNTFYEDAEARFDAYCQKTKKNFL